LTGDLSNRRSGFIDLLCLCIKVTNQSLCIALRVACVLEVSHHLF
jgi:hypothetical protein